ncbi:MAG: LytR C-terminal domain-containing protein, partial [Candidatus Cybelea sp.]
VNTTLSNAQLVSLLTVYRNVPDENVRSFTLPSKLGWVGDASVVFADPRWAKLIGTVLFGHRDPPQDEVLVANATGNLELDRTIVGALRGAGWNVPTFVDTKVKRTSEVVGSSQAAFSLAKAFATALRPGSKTALVLGADLAPDTE